jgi:hypothetical protein
MRKKVREMAQAAEVKIDTSKQLASWRQIIAAIAHLHKREFECAITLAGAAEGQLKETPREYLFKLLKKVFSHDELNLVRDWLKHQSGPENATITEFEAAIMIARAIHKFLAVYEASHPDFEAFSQWAVAAGHIPRPLSADARPKA